MKQGIHPDYGHVVFRDRSTGALTLTRSTLVGQDIDREGRVEKFQRRYGGSR